MLNLCVCVRISLCLKHINSLDLVSYLMYKKNLEGRTVLTMITMSYNYYDVIT